MDGIALGWVLDVLRHDSAENSLQVLDKAIVKPALKKAGELLMKKAEGIRDRHVKDYMMALDSVSPN